MTKLPLEVLKDEQAPAIALVAVITHLYGTECYDWDPEILRDEINRDFSISISDLQSDKIQAAIVILTTNMFEELWEVFKPCVHLLNGIPDTFEDLCPLEAEYIAAALAEVRLLKENLDTFSDEVDAFAGSSFYAYGMCTPPDIMSTAIIQEPAEPCNTEEKNKALNDIAKHRIDRITEYMQQLVLK